MKQFKIAIDGSKHMIEDPFMCSTDHIDKKIKKLYPDLFIVYSQPDDIFQIWKYDNNKAEWRKKSSGHYWGDTIGVKLTYEQITNEHYVLRLLYKLKRLNDRDNLQKRIDDDLLEQQQDYLRETEEYRKMIIDEYRSVIHSGAIYLPHRDSKGKLHKILKRY